MKVLLSGVETNNKGAELMLYAILQELERKHPDAEVFVTPEMVREGTEHLKTAIKVNIVTMPWAARVCALLKITGALNRMGIRSGYLNNYCPVEELDYFIDGSGLLFSDQRIDDPAIAETWHHRLKYLKCKGAKIVFLPQAFGPIKKRWTINTVKALGKYADLIYARDEVSYGNLSAIVTDRTKLRRSTDFTSLVDGVVPSRYSHLAGKVCIIPNIQMVSKGVMTLREYCWLLHTIIHTCRENGHDCYLLNHEGEKDKRLMNDLRVLYDDDVERVSRLNAMEVKGLISTAYIVISSRFHGAVSALNTKVPCLTTSWNHKYEELYKDYGVESGVLPIKETGAMNRMIADTLNSKKREAIRAKLEVAEERVRQQARDMWSEIWSME